jgi:hypothetical protein
MEILFVGIIVVALMAYVSTKIKKSAAAAFAEETIETEEFSLVKPENFLSPVESEDFLAFYAYSKEYGEEENAEKLRQGLIKLKILAGRSMADIVKDRRSGFDTVSSEQKIGTESVLLVGEKTEADVETIYYHKLIASDERVFDLEMSFLGDYRAKYEPSAEKLMASFHLK